MTGPLADAPASVLARLPVRALRPVLGATALLTVSALGSGCGFGAVSVPAHTPVPDAEEACAALVDALPDVVDDAVRRDVTGASEGVAAWGQPPIILRCGVPEPEGVDPTTAILDVDGVGWRAIPGEGGTFFVTAERDVVVEVAVPDDYAPEAAVLADLAEAVTATTR